MAGDPGVNSAVKEIPDCKHFEETGLELEGYKNMRLNTGLLYYSF